MKTTVILALVLAVAGCARTSPYEKPVQAGSQMELTLWRSKVGNALSHREWQLFDRAFQEMKFKVMMDKETSGGAEVGKAVFARIDGRSLYDVMHTGLDYRVQRVAAEKAEFDELYERVEKVRTLPGDQESADYLAWVRRTHAERKGKLEADLAEAKQDLADLEGFALK